MSDLRVLCVDGDDERRAGTLATLAADGIEAVGAETLADATALLEAAPVDCVVTEYELPDGSGMELIETVRSVRPDTPCLLYTDVDPDAVDTGSFGATITEYLRRREDDGPRLRGLVESLVAFRSQVGYPLPDDEAARLAALAEYDVDALGVGPAFDRLTALAAEHFGTDVAFVGLVDEHEERFVSCHGAEMAPLERENTMCTHAILEEDLLVVEDVKDDERFRHNQALDRLDIRSYAGAPMRTPEGAAVGSFCLTHDEPRTYTDAELRFLRSLADEAMEQLELRRRLRAAGGDPEL